VAWLVVMALGRVDPGRRDMLTALLYTLNMAVTLALRARAQQHDQNDDSNPNKQSRLERAAR
jgi:hypothetical protein